MIHEEMFRHAEIEDQYRDYPISATRRLVQETKVQEIYDQAFISGKTYALYVRLGTKFKCQPGNYSMALEEAKKTMLARMYGPIIAELQELRSAAYSEDPREIITICNRIQNTLMGD